MTRYVVCLLTLTLLAMTACTPSVRSTQNPTPQTVVSANATVRPTVTAPVAMPTLDWSGLLGNGVDSVDPSRADKVVQEAVDWAREASGLRAELGPHADEIFQLVEQRQAALVKELMAQWPAGAKKPIGMPARLPPRNWAPPQGPEIAALTLVSLFLSMSPLTSFSSSSSQTGDSGPRGNEFDFSLGDNATAHIKQQVTGSKLEMEFDMTIRAEKDGTTYEEHANGKISMNICPDENGNVPLELTTESKGGSGDKGFQVGTTMHAVGHVDEEGNLAGFDIDVQAEVSRQTGGRNLFGGVNTEQAQVSLGYSISGWNTVDHKGASVTDRGGTISLSYLFAGKEVKDLLQALAVNLSVYESVVAFGTAEKKWQDGYCVAVNVAEGKSQKVQAGSETPFTATVRHQFEGKDLAVPVVATLKSGGVSIAPAEVKVPAPATFRYQAPAASGQEATVELISRSRRGIGKLDVTFNTEDLYYRVDTGIGQPKVRLFGDICSLDKPFKLIVSGRNAAGGEYVGDMTFTPTGESGGNVKHTASSCIPGVGCPKCFASGTYQLVGVAEGKPVLMIAAYNGGCEFRGYSATYGGSAEQIELNPATGECSAQ